MLSWPCRPSLGLVSRYSRDEYACGWNSHSNTCCPSLDLSCLETDRIGWNFWKKEFQNLLLTPHGVLWILPCICKDQLRFHRLIYRIIHAFHGLVYFICCYLFVVGWNFVNCYFIFTFLWVLFYFYYLRKDIW